MYILAKNWKIRLVLKFRNVANVNFHFLIFCEKRNPVDEYNLVKDVVVPVESCPDDEWSKLSTQTDHQKEKDASGEVINSRILYNVPRNEKRIDDEMYVRVVLRLNAVNLSSSLKRFLLV